MDEFLATRASLPRGWIDRAEPLRSDRRALIGRNHGSSLDSLYLDSHCQNGNSDDCQSRIFNVLHADWGDVDVVVTNRHNIDYLITTQQDCVECTYGKTTGIIICGGGLMGLVCCALTKKVYEYVSWHTSVIDSEIARIQCQALMQHVNQRRRTLVEALLVESTNPKSPLKAVVDRATVHCNSRGVDFWSAVLQHSSLATDHLFLIRAITWSENQHETTHLDLQRYGGALAALYMAAESVIGALKTGATLPATCAAPDTGLQELTWISWFAEALNVGIRRRHSPALDACLVQTSRTIIWLADHLNPGESSIAALHELAHLLLDHRANTAYGLNPAHLKEVDRDDYLLQEREADAFARLLRFSILDLADLAEARVTDEQVEIDQDLGTHDNSGFDDLTFHSRSQIQREDPMLAYHDALSANDGCNARYIHDE